MAKLKVPYLVRKAGRWYFQPTKQLRAMGFEPQSFGEDEPGAVDHCRAMHRRIVAARKGLSPGGEAPSPAANDGPAKGRSGGTAGTGTPKAGTVGAAILDYKASARYRAKKPKTQDEYRKYLARIERMWGPAPFASVTPEAIARAYDVLHETAPSSAHAFGRVARLFFRWAAKRKRLPDPTTALELEPLGRGSRVATAEEILHLVAVADRSEADGGNPLVGTALLMLLTLPHNPQDVVRITYGQIRAPAFAIRRGKTDRRSYLAAPPFLTARILAGADDVDNGRRVIPLTQDGLGRRYREIRADAAKTMPSVAGLTLRDLRRTARTWAEAGGATLAQSSNFLGHSQKQAAALAEHYSMGDPALARGALEALLRSPQGAAIAAAMAGRRKVG